MIVDEPIPIEQRRWMHKNPSNVGGHHFVGVLMFMETHRRILNGEFGTIPAPIKDDAFSMGGYCLDAPETMPAGSMVYERFGPGPEEWMISQSTTSRE